MRTNITLDENLIKEAFEYAGDVVTKKDLVHLALKEFVQNHHRKDIRKLKGKINIHTHYNYKKLRKEG